MSPEDLKKWGDDLLAAQRRQLEESLPDLLAKHVPQLQQDQQPDRYDFDTDPEAAVKAMLKQSMAEMQSKFGQQLTGLTEQVNRIAKQNDMQASQFMQAIIPGAVANEEFDKKPSGFGSLTWGQARKMFEQNNDIEGLRQYANAATESAETIPKNQEITTSKARASSNSQSSLPTSSDADRDLLAVMQGRMTDAEYEKKYGG
ncbi:MAG: hypothetical protein E6Q83_03485 [Thiothrix sp.]|nr:MAG: hypothetical protein E6Q83_03485 [Thiothrix sp.]